jgi:cytidyltransferase-like protein
MTDTREKIVTLEELARIAAGLRAQGKVLVLCHGDFDLVHPGHIRHFEAAKRYGDVLAVALTADSCVDKGPGRPFFHERLRAESLAALQVVDFVAMNPSLSAAGAIRTVRPGVYVKGSEYHSPAAAQDSRFLEEKQAVEEVGGRIAFTEDITFSSSELLNTHFPVFTAEASSFLREFKKRYSAADVLGRLEALAGLKVLVIGDTIIDEYHFCRSVGKASKSSNITARFLYGESYAGGTVAVANHVAGFCQQVRLVTCLGQQNTQEPFLREHLRPNIEPQFFYRPDGPTVVKRRFVDPFMLAKMFEVSFFNDEDLPQRVEHEVCAFLDRVLGDYDLVIASDFGHGFIGAQMLETLCARSRCLALNVQTNSQNLGFNLATKYRRADYLCIDEQEARLAGSSKYGPLDEIIRALAGRLHCRQITVTRGGRGSTTYDAESGFVDVPTFSEEIVDTVGAGDAYLSIASLCAAAGQPSEVLGFVGNAMGALAVRIVGNKESVDRAQLEKFISTLLK